jgi:putative membrane protein
VNDDAPRRVHPATIAISLVKSAPSTILGLPAFLAFGTQFGIGKVILLTLAGIAVMALLTALGWWYSTYRLTEDAFVIESGVLQRSRRSIPLQRVQDVSIEQKPLARLFGLALVRIETGGGDKDEATLDSVTLAEAHRLRLALRQVPVTSGAAVPAEEALDDEAQRVFAMPLERVLLYGLFNFSLVWLAAIFALLQTLDNVIDFDWKALLGIAGREVRSHLTVTAVLSVLALAGVLGVVAGLLRTVAKQYGFRLDAREGRFRRIRGLLTRSEVVIVKARVQLALVRRGPISGRLGWQSLEFQTLGGSDDGSGRQEMAPFARADEVAQVVAAAGLPGFESTALAPVSRGHILRAAIRHGLPVLAIFTVAGAFLPLLWLGLLLVPVPVGLALLQRRHHRYGLRETSVQVARGVLSQRDWTVPYGAVQTVSVRRSWLQRRLGLATLRIDTAGAKGWHRPEIADVAAPVAAELARELAERA